MEELRVHRTGGISRDTPRVQQDGGRRPHEEQHQDAPPRRQRSGAEELSLALIDGARGHLEARFEQDAEGHARIRIVDRERGETVAVLTPEELRALAEQTGLPPGLLVQTSS
ncbi:MAG: hypothetical protein GEU80_14955 [Dehalococcoidia bacterium]|nr:hypothetical protein [Dehalococcoidia bacterium]